MELNNAMKEIEESKTFRVAMGMLLTIGNALNGTDVSENMFSFKFFKFRLKHFNWIICQKLQKLKIQYINTR